MAKSSCWIFTFAIFNCARAETIVRESTGLALAGWAGQELSGRGAGGRDGGREGGPRGRAEKLLC